MGDHVGSVDHLDCSKRSKQSPQLGKILPSIKLYVHPALPRDRYNSQHPSGQPTEETKLKKTSGRKKASSASNNNPGLSNYPVGSMAAMETKPPVIRTINIKRSSRSPGSLDPVLLSKKLEIARREQEAAEKLRDRRQATRDGTFIARRSSDTSSPPPPSQPKASNPVTKSKSTRDFHSASHQNDWATADGRPVMSHKSMFAALNLGLADLEAMTSQLQQETSKQREYLCSRCKTPDVPGQHNHHNDSESRNYSRRRSHPATSHLVAVKHGSQTAYEHVDIPSEAPPQYHALSHRGSEDLPRQRPQLQQRHNRPDWTQQSQCGKDTPTRANTFDVPSGYIFKRRDPKSTTASEVAPAAAARIPRGPVQPPPPLKESHLISDAVKLIKAKERRAKRQSFVDFLRKL